MRLSFLALVAASLPGTLCNPTPGHRAHARCVTEAKAATIVASFVSLFVNFDEGVARSILASDFTEVSDSTNFLSPNNTKLVCANLRAYLYLDT